MKQDVFFRKLYCFTKVRDTNDNTTEEIIMNKSKVAIAVSQIIELIEKIFGICWGVLCVFAALDAMFDSSKGRAEIVLIIGMLIFAAFGFWVYYLGRNRMKMRLEFKKYVAQLSLDPSGSLAGLASATGTSVEVVKKNLKYMISKKFFTDAFVDERDNRLILLSMEKKAQQQAQVMQNTAPEEPQPEFVSCTCRCCGGMSKIVKGTVGECDYCGSPLQG